MSDVSQVQQSHPSLHQLVLWPRVCACCWITLPGWEFPRYINSQQTAESGGPGLVIICHISPAEEESVSRKLENPLLSVGVEF